MTNTLRCHDCGFEYGSPGWIEAVVPHDIWNNHISPTGNEGGILCINCMGVRAAAAGLENVPVKLTAGPFVASCDERPQGQDAVERLGAKPASAVDGEAGQTP